jgi:transcriptional regulator with XRE-family HTH domain
MDGDQVANDATVCRSKFLAALRAARKGAKLTQKALGEALGCGQAKVNKMETGKLRVKPGDLDIWLTVCRVSRERRLEIKGLALALGSARPVSTAYMEMLALQEQATEILTLHSERIPKLLQTHSYSLSQHECAGVLLDAPAVLLEKENLGKLFTKEHPPSYRALLTEASLRRMPGGFNPDLVIGQAANLLDLMAAHQHVSVQILTYAAAIPWLDPDFTLMKFGGKRRDVIYAEFATEGRIHRNVKLVEERKEYWQQLQKAALTLDETKAWLEGLIKQAEADRPPLPST